MVGKALGWELQWHRAGGDCVRLVLSPPVARGLATALVAGAAVALGCGLVGGLERIGARDDLAAASAENRALGLRREALRERWVELDERFEADRTGLRAVESDGGSRDLPGAPPAGGKTRPGHD